MSVLKSFWPNVVQPLNHLYILYVYNIWMKECRFLLQEITIIQRKKQMLLVTNNSVFFFYHVGCDIILVCFLKFKCIFLPHWIYYFFSSNESVLRLVMMNLVMCMEMATRNITACIYCTLWFGCCFSCFSFYRESPEKLWILFSDTVLSTSCKYFTSTQKNQTICFVVSQQIKKTFFSSILILFCWVSSQKLPFVLLTFISNMDVLYICFQGIQDCLKLNIWYK